MPAWKKYDRVMIRWYHEFKTNTAYIWLDLITYLFGKSFSLLVVTFLKRIVHFLYQVSCVVLNAIFNVEFFLDLLSLSLFVPFFPFLLMLLQLIIFTHFSEKYTNIQPKTLNNFKIPNIEGITSKYKLRNFLQYYYICHLELCLFFNKF